MPNSNTGVISVIIPVYNAAEYLEKCLDSVINQTYPELEILCIDDCSTDISAEILRAYAEKDSRIRLFRNETNLRAAGSRNVGLDNAAGKYVYFIDADDYIDPDYLREMHEKAAATDADVVMNTNIYTHTGADVSAYVHPAMPEIPEEGCFMETASAIENTFDTVWMRLYRRSFLEKYHIRFQKIDMTEDAVFHFIVHLLASSAFAFSASSAYHYIRRDDSVTGVIKSTNRRDLQTMMAYDLIFDYLRDNDLLEKNPAKLFQLSPFFKVDTGEKFAFYQSYFRKVRDYMDSEKYNDMELFFADSVLSAASYDEYRAKHPASVAIAYIKRGKHK